MRRHTDTRPQPGYRSHGFQRGDGTSSDVPTYSSSSSGTSKDGGPTYDVINPAYNPVSRMKTPERHLSRADSPLAPETPIGERSSFSLSGQQMNETYEPRYRFIASSPNPPSSVPRASSISSAPGRAYTQPISSRPRIRNTRSQWASQQESKVKVFGIPRHQRTKDVYFAMSSYGNVMRIEMEPGSRNNGAWVVFQ